MDSQISIKNLSIVFPLLDTASRSLRSQLTSKQSTKSMTTFVGIDDISIEIMPGERIGLLGSNGAGKSTFLRTLAGVYIPQSGQLSVRGDVSSIFDVSVGLDPDVSGYDNIPLLMASRGIELNRLSEIRKDVEDFTELGEALFRPIRTYSQGMRLRIAFAVATAQKADVLLVDEIVGVGDQTFREKSKLRIDNLMKGSGTLVLASHSSNYLKSYCTRGLVFQKGKIVFDGSIDEALAFNL